MNYSVPSLSDTLLKELIDTDDIRGIVLGGSHARGDATPYSDVDLACFVPDTFRPLRKRFLYREGHLISIGLKTLEGTFVCFAQVLSRSNNQSNLHWSAFTNVPGNIGFSPVSGVIAPGQSVLITITVPLSACTPGLFFFRGPVNTHTITWAC